MVVVVVGSGWWWLVVVMRVSQCSISNQASLISLPHRYASLQQVMGSV
jgi:hypothetical protein